MRRGLKRGCNRGVNRYLAFPTDGFGGNPKK
nr:MAG TPA: hypothetical protein [Caudoviricetes sp.]